MPSTPVIPFAPVQKMCINCAYWVVKNVQSFVSLWVNPQSNSMMCVKPLKTTQASHNFGHSSSTTPCTSLPHKLTKLSTVSTGLIITMIIYIIKEDL